MDNIRLSILMIFLCAACGPNQLDVPPLPDTTRASVRKGDGAAIVFVSPLPNSVHVRDRPYPDGTTRAEIGFVAIAPPDAASVDYLMETGELLGRGAPPTFSFSRGYMLDGRRVATAVARDASGREIARTTVEFVVAASGCRALLEAMQVDYSELGHLGGATDPVQLRTPIVDLSYYYVVGPDESEFLNMDCRFAEALVRMSPSLTAHGIARVGHVGLFHDRDIAGTNTPSKHASGRALDISELVAVDGTVYNVLRDWDVDDGADPCAPTFGDAKNRVLHEIVCEWLTAGVFDAVITPNDNAAHRNHFHAEVD